MKHTKKEGSVKTMSEKQMQILESLKKLVPGMTDVAAAQLMGYGEGLAAREDRPEDDGIQVALAGRQDAV